MPASRVPPPVRQPRPPAAGIFETVLAVDGRPVELEAHSRRLEASAHQLYGARPEAYVTRSPARWPALPGAWREGGSTFGPARRAYGWALASAASARSRCCQPSQSGSSR